MPVSVMFDTTTGPLTRVLVGPAVVVTTAAPVWPLTVLIVLVVVVEVSYTLDEVPVVVSGAD